MEDRKESEVCIEKTQENPEVSAAVVEEKTSPENSEYDSVDSYSDEGQPIVKARSKASGLDSETEGSVILEREEGDGQESAPNKKVDDDEDKKNPQYIPKRGTFYEHDDRTADDIEAQEAAEADKDGKKKVWQDKKEKWKHDRFNDQEQAPKSRSELISIYGYDIRNEDGPPRARRRRRYGRGPNKYTRTWEDEEAYSKPTPVRPKKPQRPQTRPRKGNQGEEFPPLGTDDYNQRSKSTESNNKDGGKDDENNMNNIESRQEKKEKPKDQNISNQEQPDAHTEAEAGGPTKQHQTGRVGSGRVMNPKKEIKDSDYRGFTKKTRQQRGMRNDQQKVFPPRNIKKDNEFIQSQNFTNKNSAKGSVAEVEKELSDLQIQDGPFKGSKPGNNNTQSRQGSVPPRLQQSEQKGSKRYSSMRQRSLPESGNPPPANFSFYPSDYNSAAPPPATQQPILPSPIPPPSLVAQPVPVTAAAPPLLQGPFPPGAPFAPQPPPQAYLQAGPPPFIAPPSQPQIVSYVPPGQPPYVQGYQGQFNSVTQPTDLYQPQGGITYYSTDQQIVQRAAPQKRPKAAIPIVAPNDFKENKEQDKNQKEEVVAPVPVVPSATATAASVPETVEVQE